MSRSQRVRSRLFATDLDLGSQGSRLEGREINHLAHERIHPQERFPYTKLAPIDTTVGTPIHPTFGGYITGVRLSCADAPGTDLTCDVLLNGVSIFPLSAMPVILAGATRGHLAISDISFNPDDAMQVQPTDTGGATGPLVVQIEYLRAL